MKSFLIIFLLFGSLCFSYSESSILKWINSERLNYKLPELSVDEKLKITAMLYSKELANREELSHKDSNGGNGLTRYMDNGGTSLRVGEIIGAGGSITKIEKAWLKSNTHRDVILDPNWTHCGFGITRKGKVFVVVVMFTTIYTKSLLICISGDENNRIIKVSGFFFPKYRRKIKKPLLISGVKKINAVSWDPLSCKFLFFLREKYKIPFLRLAYISLENNVVFSAILNLESNLPPCPETTYTDTANLDTYGSNTPKRTTSCQETEQR